MDACAGFPQSLWRVDKNSRKHPRSIASVPPSTVVLGRHGGVRRQPQVCESIALPIGMVPGPSV